MYCSEALKKRELDTDTTKAVIEFCKPDFLGIIGVFINEFPEISITKIEQLCVILSIEQLGVVLLFLGVAVVKFPSFHITKVGKISLATMPVAQVGQPKIPPLPEGLEMPVAEASPHAEPD